jgi:sugar phosphate isomerase/epimerase
MTSYRISFQLYSARKFPPVEAQLATLAAIGYDAVEPYGGVFLDDTAGFRAKLDEAGLASPTAHFPLALLDGDRERTIDLARTLGVETVILPHLAADARPRDASGWKAWSSRLADHAAALGEAGLKLAWHNHDFEYRPLADGSRPIDHILGPPGVLWEPDIGWIVRADCAAEEELEKFKGRVAAYHIKDAAPEGVTADDGWTDIGAGTIDWPALWPAIERAGSDLLVLEHDEPSDWRGFAEHSYTYLADLLGRRRA